MPLALTNKNYPIMSSRLGKKHDIFFLLDVSRMLKIVLLKFKHLGVHKKKERKYGENIKKRNKDIDISGNCSVKYYI